MESSLSVCAVKLNGSGILTINVLVSARAHIYHMMSSGRTFRRYTQLLKEVGRVIPVRSVEPEATLSLDQDKSIS